MYNIEEIKKDPVKFITEFIPTRSVIAKHWFDLPVKDLEEIVESDKILMEYSEFVKRVINGEKLIYINPPRYGKIATTAYIIKKAY